MSSLSLLLSAITLRLSAAALRVTPSTPLSSPESYSVPCGSYGDLPTSAVAGCVPGSQGVPQCVRRLEDDFASPAEVAQLRAMMNAGFARSRVSAGPTILDVNSGWLREAPRRVVNVYRNDAATGEVALAFNASDLAMYGSIIERIRGAVAAAFGLSHLYLTTPTFVTRIRGDAGWSPADMHDEYYHPHVDMANTPRYQYSGLLYLSTAGEDFEGGAFAFLRKREGEEAVDDSAYGGGGPTEAEAVAEHVVLPRAGRLIVFSAGHENLHVVRRVESGERLVFSMWFTCQKEFEFSSFLDNRAHERVVAGGGGADKAAAGGAKRRRATRASRPPNVIKAAGDEL